MQSGGDDRPDLMEMRLNTLKENALNAGHLEEDIEVRWATDEETAILMAPTPDEVAIQEEAAAKARLKEIDIQSIRSLREWVAKQADAPQYILEHESEAILERAKLTLVKT